MKAFQKRKRNFLEKTKMRTFKYIFIVMIVSAIVVSSGIYIYSLKMGSHGHANVSYELNDTNDPISLKFNARTDAWWRVTLNRIKSLESDVAIHEYLNSDYRNKVDSLMKSDLIYDPNDPVYKFIPEAPKDWTDQFGKNERTRLIHSISELRVVVAAQSKRIFELEAKLKPQDPNQVVNE